MITIIETSRGWQVRINGQIYGTYPTKAEALHNAKGMDRNWN
jgi:hypothetical protein